MKKKRGTLLAALCLLAMYVVKGSHASEWPLTNRQLFGQETSPLEKQAMDALGNKEEQIKQGEEYLADEVRDKIKQDNSNLMELLSKEAENGSDDSATVVSRSDQYSQKRLYIFLSSSIPKDIIRRYIQAAEEIDNETLFIIRGFVDGMKKFKPTFDWVIDVLCDEYPAGSDQCLKASIDINPNLFSEFDVQTVPAFLYLPDGTAPCDMCEGLEPDEGKDGLISYGDARLLYHLTNMSETESPYKDQITAFMKKMQKSFYYNQSEDNG